jgi:hemoglobin
MDFYDRALDSDRIGPYFGDVDMRRLVDHQTKFIASLMGGPASYTNETLRNVHAPLAIDEPAFAEVLALLTEVLEDHGVDPADVDAIAGAFESRRSVIVTVAPA